MTLKYMRQIFLLSTLLLFLLPEAAFLEPSKSIEYLMGEPFSLFDWGIYKLENEFNDSAFITKDDEVKKINVSILYSWDFNRFIISGWVSLFLNDMIKGRKRYARNLNEAKEWCKSAISTIKYELGIDHQTGHRSYGEEELNSSDLIFFFSHSWYSRSEPKGLGQELDKITMIKISVEYVNGENIKIQKKLRDFFSGFSLRQKEEKPESFSNTPLPSENKKITRTKTLECESRIRSTKILFSE